MSDMKTPVTTALAARSVCGITTRTNNAAEMAGQGKIAQLWARFMQTQPEAAEILAIYHNYASDVNGDYDLTLVNQARPDSGEQQLELSAGSYLRFDHDSAEPASVIALWQSIWHYFAQTGAARRAYLSDFEHYHAKGISIYIGIVAA